MRARRAVALLFVAGLGDLSRVSAVIKILGFVNVAPGFTATPAVIDGCPTTWPSSARPS